MTSKFKLESSETDQYTLCKKVMGNKAVGDVLHTEVIILMQIMGPMEGESPNRKKGPITLQGKAGPFIKKQAFQC